MSLISSCSCLCPIHWSQMLGQEWRCTWSSADRLLLGAVPTGFAPTTSEWSTILLPTDVCCIWGLSVFWKTLHCSDNKSQHHTHKWTHIFPSWMMIYGLSPDGENHFGVIKDSTFYCRDFRRDFIIFFSLLKIDSPQGWAKGCLVWADTSGGNGLNCNTIPLYIIAVFIEVLYCFALGREQVWLDKQRGQTQLH